MEEILDKRFEVIEPKKIPASHKCINCDNVLIESHECSGDLRCGAYCKYCLPKDNLCECGVELKSNPKFSNTLKERYKIRCVKCGEQMMLKIYEEHISNQCKIECPQKCGKKILVEEIENHIEKECCNTVISCVMCEEVNKRGLIELHQMTCKMAQKHLMLIEPLLQKISLMETKLPKKNKHSIPEVLLKGI